MLRTARESKSANAVSKSDLDHRFEAVRADRPSAGEAELVSLRSPAT